MGYRIEYCDDTVIWKKDGLRWGRVVLYGCVCFLIFSALAINIWPEAGDILQSWIFPGNAEEIRYALHRMAINLHDGVSLSDAVFVFCQEIVNGAQVPG